MAEKNDRPIMTFAQLCALDPETLRSVRCLLPCREFLRAVEAVSGYAVTRRALQFYSSPQVRLMPRPVYAEGHKAHYLHPEHTLRLATTIRLRKRHFFPVTMLRDVMDRLPAEFFGLAIRDILTPDEVRMIALGDSSKPFADHLILERYARDMAADGTADCEREGEPDAAELRAALTGFDDWMAREMAAPSDLEGMENWLLEPRDHFLSEELVEA